MSDADYDDDYGYASEPGELRPEDMCPTCKGRGTVNPLTAPDWYFCVGTTECPDCEGTGEIQ